MKYIRTKDGIFNKDFKNEVELASFECWYGKILKQSNTIEKLCDEFVYHFLYNDTYSIMPQEDLEPQRRDCLLYHIERGHHDVYGAIFTDKGLIYVAKMNDKGELELL